MRVGIAGAAMLVSTVAAMLVGSASAANSRLRYASTVLGAVGAALAVALVINIIAQDKRTTTGRHGHAGPVRLSERSLRIIQSVNVPVRLTCMYASADAKPHRRGAARAGLELLARFARPTQIEIANAASDTDRANVLARISESSTQRAPKHVQFIGHFMTESKALVQQAGQLQKEWNSSRATATSTNGAWPPRWLSTSRLERGPAEKPSSSTATWATFPTRRAWPATSKTPHAARRQR